MLLLWTLLIAVATVTAHMDDCCPADPDPETLQRLNDIDSELDQLVARAQSVINTLERRKNEQASADKDSKNMLLRLDKLDLKQETNKCPKKHFKCVTGGDRRGKPCVANLLVCDGANDCLDGSDEDPNLCRFPMEIGKTWKGELEKNYCMAGLFPRNAYFTVEGIQRHETLKSFARITSRSYFTYQGDNHETIETSVAFTFIYHYGTRSSWLTSMYEGQTFKGRTEFYPAENLIYSYGYTFASDEPCSVGVYSDRIN